MASERDRLYVMKSLSTGDFDLDTLSTDRLKCLLRWMSIDDPISAEEIAQLERQEASNTSWSVVTVRLIEV